MQELKQTQTQQQKQITKTTQRAAANQSAQHQHHITTK